MPRRASGKHRRLPALVVAIAALGMAASFVPATAAGAAVCAIEGTNHYTPRLSGTDASFQVRGEASLTCAGSDAGAPDGLRSVGNVWTDPTTGFRWQEPVGQGTGSCTSTTLNTTGIVRWSDGTVTVLRQTTTSNTWGIRADGFVLPGAVLTAVDRADEQPETLVVSTTRFAGLSLAALKAAHPNPEDPLECTSDGLERSGRSGVLVLYGA